MSTNFVSLLFLKIAFGMVSWSPCPSPLNVLLLNVMGLADRVLGSQTSLGVPSKVFIIYYDFCLLC